MRESTDRVEMALRSNDPGEQLVARRLLESPGMFQTWECEHSGLMRQVANTGFPRTQAAILKKATMRLIHRKALFEYLRDRQVRGAERRQIVLAFHPTRDYTQSIIAEHATYLRKACSFLCTSHVGTHVVNDSGFYEPMDAYQALYAEYFQLFCQTQFNPESRDGELLPLLKFQLEECRKAIMDPGAKAQWVRQAELRDMTGDTVRLPRLRP
jgi:hypothetical protein